MARTTQLLGQRPGKEIVDASPSGSKRKRNLLVMESDESKEEPQQKEVEEQEPSKLEDRIGDDGLPVWDTKIRRLSSFPRTNQLSMYRRKIDSSKQGNCSLFIHERALDLEEFGRFGVVRCFERLGWEASMTFNNDGDDRVCRDAIIEWMGTLKNVPGKKPPETMKLVGYINKKPVELSFAKIKKLAKFDSGVENEEPYEYPSDAKLGVIRANEREWGGMIRELFFVPEGTNVAHWPLKRENFKMLPRLLLVFLNQNVMPRTSDKGSVRLYEVMALHALMMGTPVLSTCHLMMWGIWEAREEKEKFIIPHSRFLTKLLMKARVLPRGAPTYIHSHETYTYRVLMRANDWAYELRDRVHRLSYGNYGYLEAPREDVLPEEAPGVYVPARDFQEANEVTTSHYRRMKEIKTRSPSIRFSIKCLDL